MMLKTALIIGTALVSTVSVQAAKVELTVDGLPSGLQVAERGQFHRCNVGGDINAGGVPLQEHTILTVEPTPGFGPASPSAGIALVPRTVYSGELTVNLPNNTGCSEGEDNHLVLFVEVLGEAANGHAAVRQGSGGIALIDNEFATTQSQTTVRAVTNAILDSTNTPAFVPNTLTKNASHKLSVQYADPFGADSIKTPSLDFTQPGTLFGHSVLLSRARITLVDNNQVCLLVANDNKCAPLTQGTLVNGPVTIEPSSISIVKSGNFLNVIWPIRLADSFSSGNFTLVAQADDLDPFSYLVNGVPQPIDLLPWKPLRLPVTVP
jgi:hypothetical protein